MQKKGKHCAHCWRRSTNKQNKHKKTRFTLGSQLFLLSFFFLFSIECFVVFWISLCNGDVPIPKRVESDHCRPQIRYNMLVFSFVFIPVVFWLPRGIYGRQQGG